MGRDRNNSCLYPLGNDNTQNDERGPCVLDEEDGERERIGYDLEMEA